MFKYACYKKDIDYSRIDVINAGSPEEMVNEFRNGNGDYIHLQAPQSTDLTYNVYDEKDQNIITRAKAGEAVASIGKIIGPLSFSSLICKKTYIETPEFHKFIEIFHTTKLFAQNLSNKGIKALKYKELSHPSKKKPSDTFVVFDDKVIDILTKLGIAGAVILTPEMKGTVLTNSQIDT